MPFSECGIVSPYFAFLLTTNYYLLTTHMKIAFTGGGTGGHFYPIIAVSEAVHDIVDREKILGLKLYYFSDAPYDKEALYEQGIEFRQIPAGKQIGRAHV